ncbi:hypothetical protein [Streptomyces sp. NPDC085529]|uniref:hypothetical protein n=1 Tax=Streptomyces sp. NPDC085529 TaxID=3365729 RepID=UPI0037D3D42D
MVHARPRRGGRAGDDEALPLAAGLGTPTETAAFQEKLAQLEHDVADLRDRLVERNEGLRAARATSPEFMAQLNGSTRRRRALGLPTSSSRLWPAGSRRAPA